MLGYLRENGMESIGRFYSIYRGRVLDNNDPSKCNRIKVDVPEISIDIDIWAYPKGQNGSLGSGFKYLTPEPNDIVWVEFESGDPLNPVWSYNGWADTECPRELSSIKTLGFVTPNGNKVILDDENNIFKIQIKTGDNTYNTMILSPDNLSINTNVPINIKSESTIEISASDEQHINGSKIILNNGDTGTTDSNKILKAINLIEDDLKQLKSYLGQASGVAVPQDGGKAAFTSLAPYTNKELKKTTLEDITHNTVFQ